MTLQGKLTLGYVVLVVLIVSGISIVDLGNKMQWQFDATLKRAELLVRVASEYVIKAQTKNPTQPPRQFLADKVLADDLLDLLVEEKVILEIAVLDPDTTEVFSDSNPTRVGQRSGAYPDFQQLVTKASLLEKAKVLAIRQLDSYSLERPLKTSAGETVLLVRVIVVPALILEEIYPELRSSANVALYSVVGALALTFLFSAIAFRPLAALRRRFDLLASGEYTAADLPAPKGSHDEVAFIQTKVMLLGERLRGAQFEVTDLRGNIDRLLQDLEDAVFIFRGDQRLVFASGAANKFLGRPANELIGLSITEIFPTSTPVGLIIEQASETGRSIRNRRVSLVRPGEGSDGVGVALLAVDILPGADSGAAIMVRLRDAEAQRNIGRELQTADRLAAISKVSGGVAHEVKNPLNAILLHVEVAKSKLANGDTDVAPQMEIVSREILRLDRVVKTFLDFSRPVELHFSTVPVSQLMEEIADLARPQAEASRIRVEVKQEAEGAEVRVDPDLLKQAVLNVVVNAIEAMRDGGELRFEAQLSNSSVEIRISDTGSGIPPELRDKIFRLYFTTRKEGSGIGLAMTFRIVQLHDGTIDFSSEPGKGTTFFIRLPMAA